MIKFGPSGNDDLFYEEGYQHTYQVFEWLNNMGLDLYEYSFGRGVNLKSDTAQKISDKAKEFNILISVHAPYFINLATEDKEQQQKNEKYIFDSLEKLKILGGEKCVVHVGTQRNYQREKAIDLVKENIVSVMSKLKENGFDDLIVCPETMGKYSQIGNANEIVDICSLHSQLVPTFDFGHLNCLAQGGLQKKDDFLNLLNLIKSNLGEKKFEKLHIHFSKIEYGEKGEVKHLTFEDKDYGPNFLPLAQALKELHAIPTIICESRGTMARDALKMKKIYNTLANK